MVNDEIGKNNMFLQQFFRQFKASERNRLIEPLIIIAANSIAQKLKTSKSPFDDILRMAQQIIQSPTKPNDSSLLREEITGLKVEIQKLNAKFEEKIVVNDTQNSDKKLQVSPSRKPTIQNTVPINKPNPASFSQFQDNRVKRSSSVTNNIGSSYISQSNTTGNQQLLTKKPSITLKVTEFIPPSIPKPIKHTPKLHHLNDDQIKEIISGDNYKDNWSSENNSRIANSGNPRKQQTQVHDQRSIADQNLPIHNEFYSRGPQLQGQGQRVNNIGIDQKAYTSTDARRGEYKSAPQQQQIIHNYSPQQHTELQQYQHRNQQAVHSIGQARETPIMNRNEQPIHFHSVNAIHQHHLNNLQHEKQFGSSEQKDYNHSTRNQIQESVNLLQRNSAERPKGEFNFNVSSTNNTLQCQLSPKFNEPKAGQGYYNSSHGINSNSSVQASAARGHQIESVIQDGQSFNNESQQAAFSVGPRSGSAGHQNRGSNALVGRSASRGNLEKREQTRQSDAGLIQQHEKPRRRSGSSKQRKIYYDPRKMNRGELFGKSKSVEKKYKNVQSKIRNSELSAQFINSVTNACNQQEQMMYDEQYNYESRVAAANISAAASVAAGGGAPSDDSGQFEDRPRQIEFSRYQPVSKQIGSHHIQQSQHQQYSQKPRSLTAATSATVHNNNNNTNTNNQSYDNSHLYSLGGQQQEYFEEQNENDQSNPNENEYGDSYVSNSNNNINPYNDDLENEGKGREQHLNSLGNESAQQDLESSQQSQQYGPGATYQSNDSMNIRQSFTNTGNTRNSQNNNMQSTSYANAYAPQMQESFTDYYGGGGAGNGGPGAVNYSRHSNQSDFSQSADMDYSYLRPYQPPPSVSSKYRSKPTSKTNLSRQYYDQTQNSYIQQATTSQQDYSMVNTSNNYLNPFKSYIGTTTQQNLPYGLDRISYQSDYLQQSPSQQQKQNYNRQSSQGNPQNQQNLNIYEQRYNEIVQNDSIHQNNSKHIRSSQDARGGKQVVAGVSQMYTEPNNQQSGRDSLNRSKQTTELSPYQQDSTNKKHFNTISPERQSQQNFEKKSQQNQSNGGGRLDSQDHNGSMQSYQQRSIHGQNQPISTNQPVNQRSYDQQSKGHSDKGGDRYKNQIHQSESQQQQMYPQQQNMRPEEYTNPQEIQCEYSQTSHGIDSPVRRPENLIEASLDGEFSPLEIPEENKKVFQDDKIFFKKNQQAQQQLHHH